MTQPTHCPCSGVNLDRMLRPAILACLAKSDRHGYALLAELEAMPLFKGGLPDLTGVYRCLHEMEEEGLLVGSWDAPARGRAKRVFQITADGLACLERWKGTLDAYDTAIQDLRRRMQRALTASRKKRG